MANKGKDPIVISSNSNSNSNSNIENVTNAVNNLRTRLGLTTNEALKLLANMPGSSRQHRRAAMEPSGPSRRRGRSANSRNNNNGAPGSSRRRTRSRSRSRSRSANTSNSTFTNIITLERTPRARGILLDTKMYDVDALADMVIGNMQAGRPSKIPHSRTRMTNEQLAEIRAGASNTKVWPQAAPRGQLVPDLDRYERIMHLVRLGRGAAIPVVRLLPPMPRVNAPPLYIRRHLPAGGYKFFKVMPRPAGGIVVATVVTRGPRVYWRSMDPSTHATWGNRVLTQARARLDYSNNFTMPDQGHWVSVRYQEAAGTPTIDRFERANDYQFMSALAHQLPQGAGAIVNRMYHRGG